jgi:hypothetical protein
VQQQDADISRPRNHLLNGYGDGHSTDLLAKRSDRQCERTVEKGAAARREEESAEA